MAGPRDAGSVVKTTAGDDKDPLDRYYTPEKFARVHVRRLISDGIIRSGIIVVDAGCGDGVYMRVVRDEARLAGIADVRVVGIDLSPSVVDPVLRGQVVRSAFARYYPPADRGDVVVLGNPPFSIADDFIRHGLDIARWVSFLLQSQYNAGKGRVASGIFDHLRYCDPFDVRPKFYGPAIDTINARRAAEGKRPAGGNAVDYSVFTFDGDMPPQPDGLFTGRRLIVGE